MFFFSCWEYVHYLRPRIKYLLNSLPFLFNGDHCTYSFTRQSLQMYICPEMFPEMPAIVNVFQKLMYHLMEANRAL